MFNIKPLPNLMILFFGFFISGCINTTHLRTQKKLEKGDMVFSSFVPMPMSIWEGGLQTDATPNGVRLEGSLLRGLGNGEIGLFGGFAFENVFLGLDLRRYYKMRNGKTIKISWHVERGLVHRFDFNDHLLNFTTLTDAYNPHYWGLHIAYNGYSDLEPSPPHFNSYRRKIYRLYGIGYTRGFEKDNFQYQGDITLFTIPEEIIPVPVIRVSAAYNIFIEKSIRKSSGGPSPLVNKNSDPIADIDESKESNHPDDAIHKETSDNKSNVYVPPKSKKSNDIPSGMLLLKLKTGDKIIGNLVDEDEVTVTISSSDLGTITIDKNKLETDISHASNQSFDDLDKNVDISSNNLNNSPNPKQYSGLNKLEIENLVDIRIKNMEGLPIHEIMVKYAFIFPVFTVSPLAIPAILGFVGSNFYLSSLPEDLQLPVVLKSESEKKIYKELLKKKIKQRFYRTNGITLGIILGMFVL